MHLVTLPNNEAKYPDRISACAPRGLRDQIKRAAEAQQITPAEFMRRAIIRCVSEALNTAVNRVPDPPLRSYRDSAGARI